MAGRLRSEIKRVQTTQVEIAQEAGVHQSQVSRFGRERSLSRENLMALLCVLAKHGVDLTFVFSGAPVATTVMADSTKVAEAVVRELLPKLSLYVGPGAGDKGGKH